MRVLVTGMGGEIGTRVAQLLEERPEVERDRGIRLRAAAAPSARSARSAASTLVTVIGSSRSSTEFAPDAVAHFGVYEPDSRMSPRDAERGDGSLHRPRARARRRAPAASSGSSCAAGSSSTAAVAGVR